MPHAARSIFCVKPKQDENLTVSWSLMQYLVDICFNLGEKATQSLKIIAVIIKIINYRYVINQQLSSILQ